MGDQIGHEVKSPELRPKLITGRFFPNGVSQAALTFTGKGIASVNRTTNAGEFLVTLLDSYAQLTSFTANVQHPTAADIVPQFGAFSNLGTSDPVTFIIRTLTAAAGADITANANASVGFQVLFNDTGVS